FKGADTSKAVESATLDMRNAAVPEFTNNEAYGVETALGWIWNGTVSKFVAWHASRHGVSALPPDKLVLDNLTVRGDPSVLSDSSERPVGVAIANYISKSVTVVNADVQGMRVGVFSPFFYNQALEPGHGVGSLIVEGGFFRNQIGVSVGTGYAS